MLTDDQKRFLHGNGYVKIDRLLDPAEVAGLKERLEEVLAGQAQEG